MPQKGEECPILVESGHWYWVNLAISKSGSKKQTCPKISETKFEPPIIIIIATILLPLILLMYEMCCYLATQ